MSNNFSKLLTGIFILFSLNAFASNEVTNLSLPKVVTPTLTSLLEEKTILVDFETGYYYEYDDGRDCTTVVNITNYYNITSVTDCKD